MLTSTRRSLCPGAHRGVVYMAPSSGSSTSRATPVTTTLQPEWYIGSKSSTSKATTAPAGGGVELRPDARSEQDAVTVDPEVDREDRRQRPGGDADPAERHGAQESDAVGSVQDLEPVAIDLGHVDSSGMTTTGQVACRVT